MATEMDEVGFKRWFQRVVARSGKNIESSALFMSIYTDNYARDPQCALELGIAVLLDKPICFVALEGTVIPENLKRLAQVIEFYTDDKDGLQAATNRLINTMKSKGLIE